MTFTDCGTKVSWDWMPLAMANGIEWAQRNRRFEALYRRRLSVNAALYAAGYWIGRWRVMSLDLRAVFRDGDGGANAEFVADLDRRIASLCEAFENEKRRRVAACETLWESVKLQSHYAVLLNHLDGGERLTFASADEWIARLVQVGRYTIEDLCGCGHQNETCGCKCHEYEGGGDA